MFERNVLVKKYRGGRQEDYLMKTFAAFLDFLQPKTYLYVFYSQGFYVVF